MARIKVKNINREGGFTLLELMVTMLIISILSSVLFFAFRTQDDKAIVQKAANQMANDFREIESLAMAAKTVSCPDSSQCNAFGIVLKQNDNFYIIFCDCNGTNNYNSGDKLVRQVELDKAKISALSPSINFSVVFNPPKPTVFINGNSNNEEAVITLALLTNPLIFKIVKINSVGKIEIQ